MTEKKQQHKKKRGKVQHIRGSPKKRKIWKMMGAKSHRKSLFCQVSPGGQAFPLGGMYPHKGADEGQAPTTP